MTTSTLRVAMPSPSATLLFAGCIGLAAVLWVGVAQSSFWWSCPGSRSSTSRNQAMELGKNVVHFRLQDGRFPTAEEGLAVLLAPPSGEPLVDDLPMDPWGHPYVMRIPGVVNVDSFDVVSAGPDAVFNTVDDIGNWARR